MADEFDVFVVGGGPAGLAAAIAARKKGLQVVVADAFEPPIDKACGEGLLPATLQALKRLDVRLDSCDGYPFHGIRFADHQSVVEADFPGLGALGVPPHHPSRSHAGICRELRCAFPLAH